MLPQPRPILELVASIEVNGQRSSLNLMSLRCTRLLLHYNEREMTKGNNIEKTIHRFLYMGMLPSSPYKSGGYCI